MGRPKQSVDLSEAEPESDEELVVNGNVRADIQLTLARVTDTRRWKDERSWSRRVAIRLRRARSRLTPAFNGNIAI